MTIPRVSIFRNEKKIHLKVYSVVCFASLLMGYKQFMNQHILMYMYLGITCAYQRNVYSQEKSKKNTSTLTTLLNKHFTYVFYLFLLLVFWYKAKRCENDVSLLSLQCIVEQ